MIKLTYYVYYQKDLNVTISLGHNTKNRNFQIVYQQNFLCSKYNRQICRCDYNADLLWQHPVRAFRDNSVMKLLLLLLPAAAVSLRGRDEDDSSGGQWSYRYL